MSTLKNHGKGSRKTARAFVQIKENSTTQLKINDKEFQKYFQQARLIKPLQDLLDLIKTQKPDLNYDIYVRTNGGGLSSQVTAIKVAISRVLVKLHEDLKEFLDLSIDPRKVERKKVGCYKARAKFPFRRR